MTQLAAFLKANGIKPAQLVRVSGVSRQQLFRLRAGTADPRAETIRRVVGGCRRILGRHVLASEVFAVDGRERERSGLTAEQRSILRQAFLIVVEAFDLRQP